MRPAALRGPRLTDDHLFHVYTQLLAERLHEEDPAPFDQLGSFRVWVRAIAQHYGPGSQFLDVTKSLDVALWFALNVAERVPVRVVFGEPGRIDPQRDTSSTFQGLRFRPNDSAGYLYVFDVPLWDAKSALKHGMLVDLFSAPEVFGSSLRLRAQHACLLYADKEVGVGDLKPLAATIVVARPMTDSPVGRPAVDLFPDETVDQWYSRLLSVPLVHRASAGSSKLELAQAVPVELYLHQTRPDPSKRLIVLPPPILWPDIQRELSASGTALPTGFNPEHATPILVELPIFLVTPELGSGAWNHRILMAGLPTQTTAVDAASGEALHVDLRNVFLEFSPLEFCEWERVQTTRDELVFERAAYVEREGHAFRLWLVHQSFPDCHLNIIGPFPFFFDLEDNEIRAGTPETRLPLHWPAKSLFVVLTLLRELAEGPLLCPCPTVTSDAGALLRVQGQTARLVRVVTGSGDQIFVVRHPTRDEPFSANSNDAGVVIVRRETGSLSVNAETGAEVPTSEPRPRSGSPAADHPA